MTPQTQQTGTNNATITLRRAADRGHTQIGWLDSAHTFSFGGYQDTSHMGFRALRVINDDRVAPGEGFGEHGHRDMEILTWVLEGALRHGDNLGHQEDLRPGEVQTMSAGKGIRHSEFNGSDTKPAHFLQIWLLPDRAGHEPRYGQKAFAAEARSGRLCLIASGSGRDGAMPIHQDAEVYVSTFAKGQSVTHTLKAGRYAWLQVARGEVMLNGEALHEGDGAAVSGVTSLEVKAAGDAEVLLFDLA